DALLDPLLDARSQALRGAAPAPSAPPDSPLCGRAPSSPAPPKRWLDPIGVAEAEDSDEEESACNWTTMASKSGRTAMVAPTRSLVPRLNRMPVQPVRSRTRVARTPEPARLG